MTTDELRRQLVELDDRIRALPDDAFEEKHALSSEQDACRRRLRELLSDDLDAASDEWAERAGHKGAHSVDGAEQAGAAKVVSPGEGAGGQ